METNDFRIMTDDFKKGAELLEAGVAGACVCYFDGEKWTPSIPTTKKMIMLLDRAHDFEMKLNKACDEATIVYDGPVSNPFISVDSHNAQIDTIRKTVLGDNKEETK